MNSLTDARIKQTLSRLLSEFGPDFPNITRGFLCSLGRSLEPQDIADAYIAISVEQGGLLYTLARTNGASFSVVLTRRRLFRQ